MRIFYKAFFLTMMSSAISFAGQLDLPQNTVEAKGVFSVSANWIKDKGKKYDIRLNLQNLSDSGAIVFASNLECYRNGSRGELKYTFFNTGEKTIDFKPGETKTSNFVCILGNEQVAEEYKIIVRGVFANKTMDGKTVSEKPLIKELVWSVKLKNGLVVVK